MTPMDARTRAAGTGTVTLSVARRAETEARALAAFAGQAQGARITFASPELLWRVLTLKRWELLQALTGAGPVSIREVARRVGRDVKAVHGDVRVLLEAGLIERSDAKIVFPYEAVRVDFYLRAA